jgi:hypothetical protein
MRLLRTKSEPDRLLDVVGDSFAAVSGGMNRSKLLKVGLIVAAATAGSAAISSFRRRTEGSNS